MDPTETYGLLLETLRESMRAQRETLNAIHALRDEVQALREDRGLGETPPADLDRDTTIDPASTPVGPVPVPPSPVDVRASEVGAKSTVLPTLDKRDAVIPRAAEPTHAEALPSPESESESGSGSEPVGPTASPGGQPRLILTR